MLSGKNFLTGHVENNHPAFLLVPMKVEDIVANAELSRKYSFNLRKKLEDRYPHKHVTLTESARVALDLALRQNRVKPSGQRVLIQTTSDNFYISRCVTNTIELGNVWHREEQKGRDCLVLNHEFGYADNRALKISETERFWIEDCAFAFNTRYVDGRRCGILAPYSIFSFSKFFPIQFGGFLLSDNPVEYSLDAGVEVYISNVVGYYFQRIEEWSNLRQEVYDYYLHVFSTLGCEEYFEHSKYDIPGVFLFRAPVQLNLAALKEFYWKRGVQCSVFYGDQAFFLPLNQFTLKEHVDYFADLFLAFQENYE